MSKTFTAAFAQEPKTFAAVVTEAVAEINTTTPTGVIELVEAGPEGAIVTAVTAMPRGTVTASNLLLFLNKANAVEMYLLGSVAMGAHTVELTTDIPVSEFLYSEQMPLRLAAGDRLFAGMTVATADGVVFVAQSTDY